MASLLSKRQNDFTGDNSRNPGGEEPFWWTPAGYAVRYAVGALIIVFFLYFFIGYCHGQRRLRRGQPPLAYHRWMSRRSYYSPQRQQYNNPYQYNIPGGQQPPQGYPMEGYPPPPPAYNNQEMPPPVYQPPEGGSKVMADQAYAHAQQPVHRAGESSTGPASPSAAVRQ